MEEEKRTRAPAFPPIAWRHGRSGSGQLRKYVVPLYVLTVTLLAGCVRVQEVEDGREHRLARDLLVEPGDREARATPLAALQPPLRAAVDRHAARRR